MTKNQIDAVELEGPQEGDYVLAPTGRLGASTGVSRVDGHYFGTFDSDEDAIEAIREQMEGDQFWPNIWQCSDHGNLSLWSS